MIQCHRLPIAEASIADHADVSIDEAKELAHAIDL